MIEIKHINAFIDPFIAIMKKNVSQSIPILIKDFYLKKNKISSFDLSVFLNISGDINGRIIMGLNIITAKKIAQALGENELKAFDSIAQSTITELLNIITGNATIKLKRLNINITISPPQMVFDNRFIISTPECSESVTVPIITQIGNIDFDLVLI